MSTQYDQYIAAKADYEKATETVTRLIAALHEFSSPLIREWRKCYIEISGQGTPTEMVHGRIPLDGARVPQVIDIRTALIKQFNAQKAAEQAWRAVPQHERNELKSPPWA